MANKRVETGRGRKPGVVKSSKSSTSNRAFFLLIGSIAILGIGALTYLSTRPSGAAAAASPIDTTLPKIESQGYVIGNASAPLEVTEFGDFECPQCGRFASITEPDVRSRLVNTGTIRFRFIDYPLPMHANTWNASRAAACAAEQDKFWEMHDAIFANQDRWNGEATHNPDKVLKQIGAQIGLKTDAFNQCIDTKKTQAKVQAHYEIATKRQVNATPTFVIGDKQIAAYMPYDEFKKLVDDALAKQGTPVASPADTTKAPPTDAKKSVPVKKGQ
jgi:protein-disulfide isomerase